MRNIFAFVVGLIATLGIKQCLSCSCQPEHPAQQFCRAQFVIKAKVVSKYEIYPTDEPVFHPRPTKPPQEPLPPSPEYDIEPRIHPEILPNVERLPIGGGLRVAVGGGLRQPSGGLLPPSGGLHAPSALMSGGMFPPLFPGFNEARPIELEYTIKVDKIFKTDADVKLEPKTTEKIYTAPWDGMCGVSYLENGETYLLSGSYWDGKLRISTCNWINLYNDLTRRQKQGVKSAYKADCYEPENININACQICFHEGCTESKKDSCIWDAFSPYEDCESLHSRCTRNRRGKCQWQRKKEYKKCDLLREMDKATNVGLP